MNTIIRYLVLLGLLLGVTSVSAQNANFRSFRETKGMVTSKSKDVYVWGPWEQSSTIFAMNFTQKSIIVKDQLNNKETKYAIYDKQQKWTSKKDYKYINFECMESSTLNKYYIRLYEYDSGEYRITIMSPTNATRYSVVYMKDDEMEQIKFEDTEE
ncbi:MAG: hypothetical protein IK017_04810 [Paludibacteraceae bacterium]|nr:hypothetical protein [Paludibacteraceae bacterium]MBO7635257.1 hypothetical protein [Paludibacteraceae bacterium]MBR5971955.1 hypothetical protein [Paludibacteraceae bacterium]